MGIPSFYRWLAEKCPLAITEVIEDVPPVVNGVRVPIDTSCPNPNGIEFDNLYLDMNGIIHPCFHPEDQPGPKTYEEVFKNVFTYIDRIFSLIRPRKLLYMAVDGVAPRAKMNQQRARRFRAAKDSADIAAKAGKPSSALKRELSSLDELEQTKTLDSNVITPGTEFMALLSAALQYYIHLRMNTDPGWRGIKVILSDANVPGEGEHKIMSYIRLQRNLPGFDPNTRHCLYGLDADLIMLALATHEVHFSILREVTVRHKKPKSRKSSSQWGWKRRCKKLTQSKLNDHISMLQFQFLNIWILREYLAHDLRISDRTMEADFERLIDDFVLMCLFVGNDFLPHVPSLEISEGAIDLLVAVYKKEFVKMGGYLTDSVEVNLERVEHFLQAVGSYEDDIFRKRGQRGNRKHGRSNDSPKLPHAKRQKNSESLWSSSKVDEKKTLISITKEESHDAKAVVDKVEQVNLGDKGWRKRFYTEKFEAKTKDDREKIRNHAVFKYVEGICWVMHYYYRGVCSWQWFYPYHYAPFASDFYDLGQLEIRFTLGEPFKPLNQLMSVLPAARVLMTDSSSLISDFYPTDFEIDMNGKRHPWQAVIKLPFIVESRLLVEIAKVEHTLTDEEKRRNSLGMDILFVHISHPLTVKIFSLCEQKKDHPELSNAEVEHKIDPKLSNGMNGYICISDKPVLPPEIYSPIVDMEMITKNETIRVFYKYPPFHPHIPKLPKGVLVPVKSIHGSHVRSASVLRHEKLAVFGRRCSERPIPKSISGPSLSKSAQQPVSEYYPMKQGQTVGSTEPNGHVSTGGSICQLNSKERAHEKELNHREASSIKLSKSQKKNRAKKRAEERRRLQSQESGEANSTKLTESERKKLAKKQAKECRRLQSQESGEANSTKLTVSEREKLAKKQAKERRRLRSSGEASSITPSISQEKNGAKECRRLQSQESGEANSTKLTESERKKLAKKQAKERRRFQSQESGEASSMTPSISQEKNGAKERRRLQSQESGEASSITPSISQEKNRAKKRRRLQSQESGEASSITLSISQEKNGGKKRADRRQRPTSTP